ncbi:MAG: polyprenyl synthetase family protein [Thermoplasmata archaeon]
MEFSKLIENLAEKKKNIDEKINEYLESHFEGEILEMSKYALNDGKRLRGIILLLTSECFDGYMDKAYRLAVSAELGHAASLIHDDIIDKSVERRKRPTLWKKYGIEKAIILPHILISESLEIARSEGEEFLKVGLETWSKASIGEYLDMISNDNRFTDKISYKNLIELKSGSLFAGAAQIGILTSNEGKKYQEDAKNYGNALGISYQIADDMIDYLNGKNEEGSQYLFTKYIEKELGKNPDIHVLMGFFIYNIFKEFEKIRKSILIERSEALKLFPIFSILEIMKENGEMYKLVMPVLSNYFSP